MRKLAFVGVGLVLILVGLGFVCPQLANLQVQGSLLVGQLALLLLGGLAATSGLAGIVCAGLARR